MGGLLKIETGEDEVVGLEGDKTELGKEWSGSEQAAGRS